MIKQPKQTTSNHKRRYCAVVFFDGDEFNNVDLVIVSNNPMWGASIYIKSATKKDKKARFAKKVVLRQPKF